MAREETRSVVTPLAGSEAAAVPAARAWMADLREPQSARRAIVLREILGTPVGLR
jgi:hypothetical protein